MLALALVLLTLQANAEPMGSLLERSEDAIDNHRWAAAEETARKALLRGKLGMHQTVNALVYLGAALSMKQRTSSAKAAFLNAALIDPKFTFPRGTPARAVRLANAARAEAAGLGRFGLSAQFPESRPSNKPLKISLK